VGHGGRGAVWLFGAAAVAYSLDRVSKGWAENSLQGRPPIRVLPGVQLVFTTNSGGAFSLGRSTPWLFVGATVVVSAVIVVTAFRHTSVLTAAALGLVLGGALGNLTDRIVRGPGFAGHVIDFIDVGPWPVFNLADSAIVVGAVLLAWSGLRGRAAPERGPERGQERGPERGADAGDDGDG
jgi:signal peptidase II